MPHIKRHWLAIFISLLLFVVPFFWLPAGTVDLGGDGGRLYFYDAKHLLEHIGSYYIQPQGAGLVSAMFAQLPFYYFVAMLSRVVSDMHMLAAIHNGFKLVGGFLSVLAIVRLLSRKPSWAAILGGLFYVFNPAMTENYIRALPSHDQVFLNPLMAYLLLKFFLSGKMRFAVIAITVSVVFAHVYSYTGAPPFFAFYPLAMLFVVGYVVWVKKQSIGWTRVFLAILLFLGVHAFHFVPEFYDLIDTSNRTTARVFSKADAAEQLTYFVSVLPIPRVSLRWFAASAWMPAITWSVVVPLVIVCGFLLATRPRRTLTLVGLFTLATLYLSTAKVSDAAVELYKQFFLYVPGFSMFRNFYGQWQFVFFFFYSILFGVCLAAIFSHLGRRAIAMVSIFIAGVLVIRAIPFLNGTMVNQKNHLSDTRVAVAMDPKYSEMLSFIRTLPSDGKILVLPFTDCCYGVIHGTNNGAYVGKSPVGSLTGKHDFAGYDEILPFSDTFWRLSREKNYQEIKKLLGILNIRYVFYNSDPRVYDATFPSYPYDYARKHLPDSQEGYREFVDRITTTRLYSAGTFELYETERHLYLPLFYVSSAVLPYKDDSRLSEYAKAEAFFKIPQNNTRDVYIEQNDFLLKNADVLSSPSVTYSQISPVKYRITVSAATEPYLLVMLMRFNEGWKVYSDMIQLAGNSHFRVNGYANAWYITPEATGMQNSYELIVELDKQRLFFVGLTVSLGTAAASLIISAFVYGSNRKSHPSSI